VAVRGRSARPRLEALEERSVPALLVVNSLIDAVGPPGVVTLRSAITQAESDVSVPATITFSPSLSGQTITLNAPLPTLSNGETIAGPGADLLTVSGNNTVRVFTVSALTAPVSISGLTITGGNSGNASGGGVLAEGDLRLSYDIIIGNTVPVIGSNGGGVSMTAGLLTIRNTLIANNSAPGGGLVSEGGGGLFIGPEVVAQVTASVLSNNAAVSVGQGGGIANNGTLALTDCTVASNTATADGAGIYNNGNLTLTGCSVVGNVAQGVGGGVLCTDFTPTVVVTDCTIANNVARGGGGGLVTDLSSVTIDDRTITGNVDLSGSSDFAGGLTLSGSAVNLMNNTVVAQNRTTGSFFPDVRGFFAGGSSNFIGVGDSFMGGVVNGMDGNIVGTPATPADPRLGPLQDNGGPTLTRLPLPDSLLIDAGFIFAVPAGLTTDQRGLNRVVNNRVDIGATEFQFPATAVTLTSSANPAELGTPVTFTATVSGLAPGSNTPTGTVTFSAGGAALGTSDLVNGVAAFTTAALPAGTTDVTATYGGDTNFSASSATVAQQITLPPPPPPPPVQTVGVFDPVTATWYLRSANSAGPPDAGQFAYGGAGCVPVTGDWAGNGTEGVGAFDPSTATWYLRNDLSAGPPDAGQFQFGGAGWVPVTGDWSNSGHTGVGAFDPTTATWYLRNEDSAGPPDAGQFAFGGAGWQPLVGDWAGSGHLGVGVFDPSTGTFYLRNSLGAGAPDFVFQFGGAFTRAVAGDWSGSGHTGVGVFDPVTATFYLRNTPSAGAPDFQFAYGGQFFTPVVGDFDALALATRAAARARRTDALDVVFAGAALE
jgi:hypothetical protein